MCYNCSSGNFPVPNRCSSDPNSCSANRSGAIHFRGADFEGEKGGEREREREREDVEVENEREGEKIRTNNSVSISLLSPGPSWISCRLYHFHRAHDQSQRCTGATWRKPVVIRPDACCVPCAAQYIYGYQMCLGYGQGASRAGLKGYLFG